MFSHRKQLNDVVNSIIGKMNKSKNINNVLSNVNNVSVINSINVNSMINSKNNRKLKILCKT